METPWEGAEERYSPMSAHTGTVTKMTKYGAFVELEPGIVGLIHTSSLKEAVFSKGDSVNVRIRSILPLEQRVSLALVS